MKEKELSFRAKVLIERGLLLLTIICFILLALLLRQPKKVKDINKKEHHETKFK